MSNFRMVNDPDEFLSLLVRSHLIEQEQLDQLMESYQSKMSQDGVPDTIAALCSFLIASDVLTSWQCGNLREGKYKGFFLGELKLMDTLGADEDFSYYLAVDTKDDSYCRVAVTPRARGTGIKTEYRVVHRYD